MRKVFSRSMFKSKIHGVTITHADPDFEGGITVDADLLDAADILPYEEVVVCNATRGVRLTTYALAGERGSGVICLNGMVAHMCRQGDVVSIETFATVEETQLPVHGFTIVLVDSRNRIKDTAITEVAGPGRRFDLIPSDEITRRALEQRTG